MTDTNQKLRDSIKRLLKAHRITVQAPPKTITDAENQIAEIQNAVKFAEEALALPTADHIPEILFARDIYDGLGYAKWENFNTLIKRCKQLIAHGQHEGSIQDTERFVEIGYGARRRVIDYKLDAKAHQLVISMASAFKLVGHYPSRNETSILSFIERWCKAKNISFIAQSKEISGHVFDALVGGSVAIEFDEPHHLESRQSLRDANKDRQSNESGIHVLRIGLESNVIDVIVDIESILSGKMINGLTQSETDASASVSGLTAPPVGELPELPEPTWSTGLGVAFTADQMRAYATSALSAGDAADAQRYRWLRCASHDWGICEWDKQEAEWIRDSRGAVVIDAAIDAAMRKGQL